MAEDKMIKIATAGSYAEAEQIVAFLKENGIASYRQGGVMDVYSGNSVAGEDVMALEKDREAAQALLKDFQPIRTTFGVEKPKESRTQRIFSWIIAVIVILLCIVLPIFLL